MFSFFIVYMKIYIKFSKNNQTFIYKFKLNINSVLQLKLILNLNLLKRGKNELRKF